MVRNVNHNSTTLRIWEVFAVILLSAGIVFGVLLSQGTLISGWHLVDDHEYLEYLYDFQYLHRSLADVISSTFLWDIHRRLRPLYYPLRILMVYLFGANLELFSVIKGVEITASITLLCNAARRMGLNIGAAFLFGVSCLVGYQSAVWWKLGPQEAFGTLLFAIGFNLLISWMNCDRLTAGAVKQKGRGTAYAVLSFLVFMLMAAYKESFMALLPFIAGYVLYDAKHRREHTIGWRDFFRELSQWKGRLVYAVLCFMVCVAAVLYTLKFIGTTGTGTGLGSSIGSIAESYHIAFQENLKWYGIFGALFIAILLTYWEQLKKMRDEIALTLIFIAPQILLHSNAPINERYLLPLVIGFYFFFIVFILGGGYAVREEKDRLLDWSDLIAGLLFPIRDHRSGLFPIPRAECDNDAE